MIRIGLPGTSQEAFDDAVKVLEECISPELPRFGFVYPFMGPGGQYGNCWWERDTALTLSGYKWIDQKFAENVLRNFILVQRPNGRIPLWGPDRVGNYDEQLSAIPVLFEAALKVLRRSKDNDLIEAVYRMLARYFDWWLSDAKCDPATGLVCGIFEESDPSDVDRQLTSAPVDLNVQVCVGADVLRELAERLGYIDDAANWRQTFEKMKERINAYLYSRADGGYYTYLTKERRLYTDRIYNSMFDVFKRGIVPPERIPALVKLLEDPAQFDLHGKYALVTASRASREYVETVGVYQGWTSWSGNIWTFRNEIIATGLRESGLNGLAAELAYKTVTEFSGNYAEFMSPSTGEGHGVKRYGWTASQYIQLIIEELFGISDNVWTGTVTVAPNLPAALAGKMVHIDGVPTCRGLLSVTAYLGPDNVTTETHTFTRA
jgi:glycogen debranching enzyme